MKGIRKAMSRIETKNNKDCLLVLSGGMESVAILHLLKDRIKTAVIFKYGNRAWKSEIYHAYKNVADINIKYTNELDFIELKVIDISQIALHTKSGMLGRSNADLSLRKSEDYYYPFRNGIFASIAGAVAESQGLKKVILGICKTETACPDATKHFELAMNNALMVGTEKQIQCWAPYMSLTKPNIADKLFSDTGLNISEISWSCFEEGRQTNAIAGGGREHCGKCTGCMNRKKAFQELLSISLLKIKPSPVDKTRYSYE